MKKVTLFASLVAVSILAAAATAYTVNQITGRNSDSGPVFSTGEVGNHFTVYEKDNYPDLTYAAENAVKGVVNIEVTQAVESRAAASSNPFYEFFGQPQPREMPRERTGTGSGVIISPDGYIVTNNHVVENASKVKVTLEDKTYYDAKVIGTDPTTDIALIKIDAKDLPTLVFGDSDKLRLGEWVLAIGSPYGLNNTVTSGIVSAKARGLGVIDNQLRIESFIQTDAAVNPGNSGGALVNVRGELVGINTVIKSPTGSFAGYSFSVPSTIVQKVVMDLKEHGVVQRALLGIGMREIDSDFLESETAKEAGIKEIGGVYVASVDPEGAAKDAGIKVGDVITAVDDVKIDGTSRLTETIARHRPKDKVSVTVKRNGQVKQFEVTLRNRSGNTKMVEKDVLTAVDALKGRFTDVSDKQKKELNINGGAVVASVEQGGLLARARIRPGYIITQINDRAIRSANDLNRISDKIEMIEGVYPNGQAANYSFVNE